MKILSRSTILTALLLTLSPFSASGASYLDVAINEVAWMGQKVEGVESKNWWRYEWLELYNNTNQVIPLEGWKIELYRTGLDWSLILGGEIKPGGYFLIVSSEKIFPDYNFDYSNLSGKFNNAGQKILLKDKAGNIIDDLDCFSPKKWFGGDNAAKQTMERINPLLAGNISSNWQTSRDSGGTPGTRNSEGKIKQEKETARNAENPKEKESPKEQPAEPASIVSLDEKESGFFPILPAFLLAVFSGIIILILEKKIKL